MLDCSNKRKVSNSSRISITHKQCNHTFNRNLTWKIENKISEKAHSYKWTTLDSLFLRVWGQITQITIFANCKKIEEIYNFLTKTKIPKFSIKIIIIVPLIYLLTKVHNPSMMYNTGRSLSLLRILTLLILIDRCRWFKIIWIVRRAIKYIQQVKIKYRTSLNIISKINIMYHISQLWISLRIRIYVQLREEAILHFNHLRYIRTKTWLFLFRTFKTLYLQLKVKET